LVTGWIQPAPVASRTEPRLVARADLGALNAYLTECGVSQLIVYYEGASWT